MLEKKINEYFKKAFNLDLIVNRFSGSIIHLHVGIKPILESTDTIFSSEYQSKIRKLPLLTHQGDGMRSFTSVLLEIFTQNNSVIFIDEPEAFLHPPQARLLGRLIAKELNDRQIVISTHSSDFIKGLLESNKEEIKVIRIQRENDLNVPSLLNNDEIKTILERSNAKILSNNRWAFP